MTIELDPMDAALVIQSIQAMDWEYINEEERATRIVTRIRAAAQEFAKRFNGPEGDAAADAMRRKR